MGSAVTCNLEKMELTDQEWLELNRQSLEGWGRLAIARFRREPDGVIADIAGEVLVHHRGRFIAAKDLAAQIVRGVQNNLIFESWNYECASAIDSAAWGLTLSMVKRCALPAAITTRTLASCMRQRRKPSLKPAWPSTVMPD